MAGTIKTIDFKGTEVYLDPTSHAVSTTDYGVGTGSLYGHLKLSDAIDSTSSTSGGFAATPNAVKKAAALGNATGTLAVSHGGTGVTTLTSGQVLIGNGTSAVGTRPITTSIPASTSNTDIPTAGAVRNALSNVDLANSVTGILAISHGGTGASSLTTSIGTSGTMTNNQVPSAKAVAAVVENHTSYVSATSDALYGGHVRVFVSGTTLYVEATSGAPIGSVTPTSEP